MDYAKAKAIVTEYAPNLTLDAEDPDRDHTIIVRKSAKGQPFNITLSHAKLEDIEPTKTKTAEQIADEQEHKLLTDALDSACRTFGIERGA